LPVPIPPVRPILSILPRLEKSHSVILQEEIFEGQLKPCFQEKLKDQKSISLTIY
ncbi:uncharacterized protein METZ01_LOCUS208392, partial [marine metagenome]